MTEKKLDIYWLTIETNKAHEQKAALLSTFGYNVTFFKTLDALTKEIQNRRAPIIVIGDEGPEVIVVKAISLLRRMPDIQGARLILSTSRYSPVVMRAAACEGFRDVLALDMDNQEWLERFLFSTSGVASKLKENDHRQLFNADITLAIPARLVWVGKQDLWIESRIFPTVDTRLTISGPFAQATGHKFVNLSVDELHDRNLSYRFSEALVGRWNPHSQSEEKIQETLSALRAMDVGARYKLFLAIQSPALRSSLLRHLNSPRIEVHTALQKRSMIDEPRYFSPDLVFIEDRLCRTEHQDRCRAMIKNMPDHCGLVVIGQDKDLGAIRTFLGERPLYVLKRLPVDLETIVLEEFLVNVKNRRDRQQNDSFHIPSEHEFSLAEINVPAQIESLSDHSCEITVPFELGNFGLARVKFAPFKKLFDRYPYSKIASISYEENPRVPRHHYRLVCRFCDLSTSDLKQMNMLLDRYHYAQRPNLLNEEAAHQFFNDYMTTGTHSPSKGATMRLTPEEHAKESATAAAVIAANTTASVSHHSELILTTNQKRAAILLLSISVLGILFMLWIYWRHAATTHITFP